MEYPFPLPVLSKLPKIEPGSRYMYCPVTPKEISDYFKAEDLPMLGILPVKSKEYWDALAKKYPEGQDSMQSILPIQILAQKVLYRLTTLYPKLISFVMDVQPLSPGEKGIKMFSDLTSFGAVSAIEFAAHKLLEGLYGCSIHQLDLSSPSVTGTIDKYLGSSHSVLIAMPIIGAPRRLRHATVVTKQPDGTYEWFDSNGDYIDAFSKKKLQNFIGPDKEVDFRNYCKFQTTRGACLLWAILSIIFPDKPKLELHAMLINAKTQKRVSSLPNDLVLIAMFENFVEMTDRKLDELPPSIKAKLRTALGGRRKTRRVKNRRGGGPWSPHDYLYEGSMSGNLEWVRKGIADGANVNEQYTSGTNLIFASRKGYTEIVRALLAAGANPNIPRYDNDMTPLIASATYGPGYTEIGRLLIAAGANVNAVTKQNYTALWSAAERGNVEMVRDLLAAGADQTIKPDDGTTVYDIAKTQEIRDLLVPSAPPAASPPPTPIDIPSDREDPITLEPFVEGEKVGCFPNSNPRIRTMCYKLSSIQGLIERIGYDGLIKNPETREKFPLSSIIYGIAHLVPPVGGKRRTRRNHRKHKPKTGKRKTRK